MIIFPYSLPLNFLIAEHKLAEDLDGLGTPKAWLSRRLAGRYLRQLGEHKRRGPAVI